MIDEQAVFSQLSENVWRPNRFARGPFQGVQGGAVAGLMCAVAEDLAGETFTPVATTAAFLRPTPMSELRANATIISRGRRVATVEVRLSAGETLCAVSMVTLVAPFAVPAVKEHRVAALDPTSLPLRESASRHGEPWLMDLMEGRVGTDGIYWYRFPVSLTGKESLFARLLAPADWTVGISRPDRWDTSSIKAIPNVELSVHMSRSPASEWLGIRASSDWRQTGSGLAMAELFDRTGPIGRVGTTLVLVP